MVIKAIISGPPCSGKTSLCALLHDNLNVVHVATGDLLRENIKNKTELGKVAKDYITRKALIPDHVILQMVVGKINSQECKQNGWILDGFPRTVDQASLLAREQITPDRFILLQLQEKDAKTRISGRRIDPITGKIFHASSITPTNLEIKNRLKKRSDDTVENLHLRLEAYRTHGYCTNSLYKDITTVVKADKKLQKVYSAMEAIVLSPCKKNMLFSESYLKEDNSSKPEEKNPGDEVIEHAMQNVGIIANNSELKFTLPHDSDEEENTIDDNNIMEEDAPYENSGCNEIMAVADDLPKPIKIEVDNFKSILTSGMDIKKHGRRGNPHPRTVFCDINCKRIFWQKVGGKELKPRIDHSILLSEVIQVVQGIKTEVFKRSGDINNSDLYLSLIADDRTLDIEAQSEKQCEILFKGLSSLILS